MTKQPMTDDPTDVETWEQQVKGLHDNRAVFEGWCGDCMRAIHAGELFPFSITERFGIQPGRCDCKEPSRIFVGKSTADACAWDAAGILLELVQQAAVIIKRQGDELDQEAARSVRDEETIGQLREQIDQLRKDLREEQKEAARAERDAARDGYERGQRESNDPW